MKTRDYDRLLMVAEHGDLTPEERLRFIEETEVLADAPGGVHAALPNMMRRAALLGDPNSEKSRYLQEAIHLLQELEQ